MRSLIFYHTSFFYFFHLPPCLKSHPHPSLEIRKFALDILFKYIILIIVSSLEDNRILISEIPVRVSRIFVFAL